MNPGFEIDHIGIAVESLGPAFQFYKALGWDVMSIEEVPTEQVKVGFIEFENSRIELLEPTTATSTVRKFLDKRGPGIHHICFRVKNIEQILIKLKAQGIRLIHDNPVPGAHNCKVAFIHPSSANGVLVELSESAS